MKNLGILVLAEPRNGGTFQYTMSMLQALRHLKDWQVILYTNSENHYYDNVGYRIQYIDASRKNWYLYVISYIFGIKLEEPFKEIDILLAPIYSPILLHTHKPFSFTLHDLQEHYFPEYFSWGQRTWRNFINSHLIKRAKIVICESSFVKLDIMRFFGVGENKIAIITAPPIRLKQDKLSQAEIASIQRKYLLPKKYLFYPAQFWPHKNHVRLLDAFSLVSSEFPDLGLVLTGNKNHEYKRIFEKVNKLGLTSRIVHIGYIEQCDMLALYSASLALVMPTLFESVSIPVYEAFQCGIPVCVSNVVALPEQVGDAGLLFDPLSVHSIAEAMREIINSDELRARLVHAGNARFEMITDEDYACRLKSILHSMDGAVVC